MIVDAGKSNFQTGQIVEAKLPPPETQLQLFRVVLKVRPSPGHPQFFSVEFGWLSVWVFGSSHEDAGQRADSIISALPYERVRDKAHVTVIERPSTHPTAVAMEAQAREIGIAVQLWACKTGTAEEGFGEDDVFP